MKPRLLKCQFLYFLFSACLLFLIGCGGGGDGLEPAIPVSPQTPVDTANGTLRGAVTLAELLLAAPGIQLAPTLAGWNVELIGTTLSTGTNSDGGWFLDKVPPGVWDVLIHGMYDNKKAAHYKENVLIRAGKLTDLGSARLQPASTLTVIVEDARSATLLQGARVTVAGRSAITDATGTARLDTVPAMTLRVKVERDQYTIREITQTFDGVNWEMRVRMFRPGDSDGLPPVPVSLVLDPLLLTVDAKTLVALDDLTAVVRWADDRTAEVSDLLGWTILTSGGGSISGTTYVADTLAGTTVLEARYSDPGGSATAQLQVVVRRLPRMLTLSPATIEVETGTTVNLGGIVPTVTWTDGTTTSHPVVWSLYSGGGSLEILSWHAPMTETTAFLNAQYQASGVTLTAQLEAIVRRRPHTLTLTPATSEVALGGKIYFRDVIGSVEWSDQTITREDSQLVWAVSSGGGTIAGDSWIAPESSGLNELRVAFTGGGTTIVSLFSVSVKPDLLVPISLDLGTTQVALEPGETLHLRGLNAICRWSDGQDRIASTDIHWTVSSGLGLINGEYFFASQQTGETLLNARLAQNGYLVSVDLPVLIRIDRDPKVLYTDPKTVEVSVGRTLDLNNDVDARLLFSDGSLDRVNAETTWLLVDNNGTLDNNIWTAPMTAGPAELVARWSNSDVSLKATLEVVVFEPLRLVGSVTGLTGATTLASLDIGTINQFTILVDTVAVILGDGAAADLVNSTYGYLEGGPVIDVVSSGQQFGDGSLVINAYPTTWNSLSLNQANVQVKNMNKDQFGRYIVRRINQTMESVTDFARDHWVYARYNDGVDTISLTSRGRGSYYFIEVNSVNPAAGSPTGFVSTVERRGKDGSTINDLITLIADQVPGVKMYLDEQGQAVLERTSPVSGAGRVLAIQDFSGVPTSYPLTTDAGYSADTSLTTSTLSVGQGVFGAAAITVSP